MDVQKNWEQAALWETGGRQIDITLYYTLSLTLSKQLNIQAQIK